MSKGSRGKRDYEREIEEAAKRMRKYSEHLKAARSNQAWNDFLLNVVGVEPQATESKNAQKFWKSVKELIEPRQATRRNIYQEAKQAGMPTKLARRIRDWSPGRAREAIENWQARH